MNGPGVSSCSCEGVGLVSKSCDTVLSFDNELEQLFNLNHQPFSGWSYTQRFQAIPTIERLIKENSRQGRRSDLAEKREHRTCVQSWQGPNRKGRRQTTRDLMAQQLGISTATFSKYRSILKLSEELVEAIAKLLDENRISFEAAYRILQLTDYDAKVLVRRIQESSERELKLDMDKLKKYAAKSQVCCAFRCKSSDSCASRSAFSSGNRCDKAAFCRCVSRCHFFISRPFGPRISGALHPSGY